MLNNRQNGRRRGRGRGPNPGGPRGNESRIDSRARGNAPQLLEKYKNMARDAQLSGDRVMTEYYLQFADHYFRIVAESRARFEEQQQRRPRDDWREEGYEGEDGDDQPRGSEDGGDEDVDDAQAQPRNGNRQRGDRNERSDRNERNDRNDSRRRDSRREARPRDQRDEGSDDAGYAPVPEGVADGVEAVETGSGIDVAVLPPALGVTADPIPDLDDEPAPTPRKRGRPRKVVAEEASAES
ncbi:MAG: DUF4167 domain-containing protein [Sphingomonadales bacterium]|nr:DUF4167 domain-containing protein [Sphingomonadales bacterium]